MALFRHRVVGTSPGEQWSFTLHTTGTGTDATANAVWASAVGAMWTGQLDALVADELSVVERSTTLINEATEGQVSRTSDPQELPGAATTEMLPYQVALVISLHTSLANRHGRGRFYLPPLVVGVVESGRLSATAQATVAAAVESLFTELASGGLTPVVRDRVGHVSTVIDMASVGDVLDTQRRRRNKLVENRAMIAV